MLNLRTSPRRTSVLNVLASANLGRYVTKVCQILATPLDIKSQALRLLVKFLKNRNKQLISNDVAFATWKTDAESLLNLIKSLRPKKTENGLVRLGPAGDGGYLVPNDFEGIIALFSPGVSSISGFEKDCAAMGLKVYLADKSVEGPAEDDELFSFTKKFIGCMDNANYMTLDAWVDESLPSNKEDDLILQMDIEGGEYESLLSVSTGLMKRLRIIVLEVHNLEQLWCGPFFEISSRMFEKLLQFHSCVHIHPNNCCGSLLSNGIEIPRVVEFTFLRNDRGVTPEYVPYLPNDQDSDNTSNTALGLSALWVGGNSD